MAVQRKLSQAMLWSVWHSGWVSARCGFGSVRYFVWYSSWRCLLDRYFLPPQQRQHTNARQQNDASQGEEHHVHLNSEIGTVSTADWTKGILPFPMPCRTGSSGRQYLACILPAFGGSWGRDEPSLSGSNGAGDSCMGPGSLHREDRWSQIGNPRWADQPTKRCWVKNMLLKFRLWRHVGGSQARLPTPVADCPTAHYGISHLVPCGTRVQCCPATADQTKEQTGNIWKRRPSFAPDRHGARYSGNGQDTPSTALTLNLNLLNLIVW